MRILVNLKGGSSSIDGDVKFTTFEEIIEFLKDNEFIIVKKIPNGEPQVVSRSAIGYISRKQ